MIVGDLVIYQDQVYLVVKTPQEHPRYVHVMNIATTQVSVFPRSYLSKIETDKK